MALELLQCTICPKQPYFSDTSHLLTHVGSKGHLSHLHKLQVRSHGDFEASQQLAVYNTWYLKHNLADLLAGRLQQKQIKQANHRVTNRKRRLRGITNTADVSTIDTTLVYPVHPNNHHHAVDAGQNLQDHRRDRRRIMQEEMDDPDYISSLSLIYQDDLDLTARPPVLPLHCDCEDTHFHDAQCPLSAPLPPSCLQPLEYTRLKGQVWPGMDVFDSATEEQARKRNQRKDQSVVTTMYTNSMMIEPTELTFSANGSLKRRRHLDELDDESTLLEGETPLKRLTMKRPRRERPKLENKQSVRSAKLSKTPKLESFLKSTPPSAIPMPTSSSLLGRFLADRQSSPILAPNDKKKRAKKQKRKSCMVYQDANSSLTNAFPPSDMPNPFLNASTEYRFARDIDLSLNQLSWYQAPSIQTPQYDPFREYRRGRPSIQIKPLADLEKENMNSPIYKQELKQEYGAEDDAMHLGSLFGLNSDLEPLSHIYAYTRNPLMELPGNTLTAQNLHPLR